ncbi:MAG: aryl-sulfate sulfotransferase [Flavobacteriales bacterium]|nr:aryl-sulfate sulfotransferase [Flavobacteriales bacterium]
MSTSMAGQWRRDRTLQLGWRPIWSYSLSNDSMCQHHDFTVMPNGNILTIVWELHSSADAFAHGKDTSYSQNHLWSEKLLELHPTGPDQADIVWTWRAWDHLVQNLDPELPNFAQSSQRPERIDINYRVGPPSNLDWLHQLHRVQCGAR